MIMYVENAQLYKLNPPRSPTIVGMTVARMVVSSAARNAPHMMPRMMRVLLGWFSSDGWLARKDLFFPKAPSSPDPFSQGEKGKFG